VVAESARGIAQERWAGKQKDNKQRDIRSFLPPPLEASASLTGRDGSMSADSPHGLPDRKVLGNQLSITTLFILTLLERAAGVWH